MSSSRAPASNYQDYFARIRYSNTLPPPPVPTKLLHVPGTGLADGQYTSAAYASRLARDQPLNIEADAELGMPIDLIGIPGVFDGDETAIMARDPPVPVDARDRALLRPLAVLGKSNAASSGVSFLRRTEYISNDQSRKFDASSYKEMMRAKESEAQPKRRKQQDLDKEDPLNILRHVIKGFDVAYANDIYEGEDTAQNIRGAKIAPGEKQAWENPQHPSKPNLELLDSYPVLPDLEALPSIGSYILLKFDPKSLGGSSGGTYDARLDFAILRPQNPNEEQHQDREAQYEHDLDMIKQPMEYDYEYYLADDVASVAGIKRKFDTLDPDNDNDELYTTNDESGRSFRYDRVRTYETQTQSGNLDDPYADSVAIALHDGDGGPRTRSQAKAAYFYPILQRTSLRPKRKGPAHLMDSEQVIDQLRVTMHAPDQDELDRRVLQRAKLDPTLSTAGLAVSEMDGQVES